MSGGHFPWFNPPFRAEHVGSLLRPAPLLDARRRHRRHEIDDATLLEAETSAIRAALELQERVGLRVATDGEFRRAAYHSYFYGQLGDISFDVVETGTDGRAAQPVSRIRSRLHWVQPIHVDDFAFVKSYTSLCPKITIPGPCALHFRGGDEAVLAHAYDDIDAFWDDIVVAFRSELASLAAAGCRYVQIDETAFAKFGDPAVRAMLAARGDDWSALIKSYIAVTNRVMRDLPESLTIAMHLCRGNRGGRWHAEGSYDAVAEMISPSGSFFWSTTLRARADSRRCASRRPTRWSCLALFPPRAVCSKPRTTCSDRSRRPAATSISPDWD
jgi:5-methyltetrahydropteroyltriglutamate--homocysteine methyltransferase